VFIMAFKVLGIKLRDVKDLIRLHVNLKRERLGLLSYRVNSAYHIGFYFSPVIKEISAVFTYVEKEEKPSQILAYSISGENDDVINGYVDSPQYANIPVAFLNKSPHIFIDPDDVELSYDVVPVEDIMSLVSIALSTHIESAMIPFIWYDEKHESYVLNVEASSDDEEAMVIFTYGKEKYLGRYVEVNYKEYNVEFVSRIRDISKRYIIVIRVEELPFFKFKVKKS